MEAIPAKDLVQFVVMLPGKLDDVRDALTQRMDNALQGRPHEVLRREFREEYSVLDDGPVSALYVLTKKPA